MDTATDTLDVRCWIVPAAASSWTGTVYFDDVRID